jgi:hypothetical protein
MSGIVEPPGDVMGARTLAKVPSEVKEAKALIDDEIRSQ